MQSPTQGSFLGPVSFILVRLLIIWMLKLRAAWEDLQIARYWEVLQTGWMTGIIQKDLDILGSWARTNRIIS